MVRANQSALGAIPFTCLRTQADSYRRTFHVGNTGSNPVGDASEIEDSGDYAFVADPVGAKWVTFSEPESPRLTALTAAI